MSVVSLGSVRAADSVGKGAEPTLPLLKPNVLLILADDLGYGDLGSYGQTRIKTPVLDRLAAEGMRFTQAYAGSSLDAPSRAALLTGIHTGHNGIRGDGEVALRAEDRTIAEVLKAKGYNTGAAGVWGVGSIESTGLPNLKGFDEWFGHLDFANAQNYYPDRLWRNRVLFLIEGNLLGAKKDYAPDWFTRVSTNFFRMNTNQPFFMYLAYPIPRANLELAKQTGMGMEVPSDEPYSRESWPTAEKNKAAMITRMDRDVGRLLDVLRSLRLDENTLVIFSSDNGPHSEGGVDAGFFKSAGPFRGGKRDLYEGGLRVPFIVNWPGKIKPGSVNSQVVALWDILPTLAALVRAEAPKGMDGISLASSWLGLPQPKQHEYLYWELHQPVFQQALRAGDWKLIRPATNAPPELYDLAADPAERVDLSAKRPEQVKRLTALLRAARTDSVDWPIGGRKATNTATAGAASSQP